MPETQSILRRVATNSNHPEIEKWAEVKTLSISELSCENSAERAARDRFNALEEAMEGAIAALHSLTLCATNLFETQKFIALTIQPAECSAIPTPSCLRLV